MGIAPVSPVRFALMFGLLFGTAVVHADTVVHMGATNQSIRLNEERANDEGMVDVATRVCAAFVEQLKIPAFYCESQVHFSIDGREHMPAGWESHVARSLRAEVSSSQWLMQRLELNRDQLEAMPIETFINGYLKQPKRASIIRSWLSNRIKQLQPHSKPHSK